MKTATIITAIERIRRINRIIALSAGGVLSLCVLLIIIDVLLRTIGISFGGAEEISGYVMAAVSSWGMSYAMTECAHVRIDLIRQHLNRPGKALLDLVAIVAMAGVAIIVAFRCIPVLGKSLSNQSKANTVLETPLWIPQTVWLSGWLYFALCASTLVLLALILLLHRDYDGVDALVGSHSEMELES